MRSVHLVAVRNRPRRGSRTRPHGVVVTTALADHTWTWVPETEPGVEMVPLDWSRQCRYGVGPGRPGCGAPAVWRVSLGGRPGYELWAPYCGGHTFGRRIVDGRLLVCVLRAVA